VPSIPRHDIVKEVNEIVLLSAASLNIEYKLVDTELVIRSERDCGIWHPEGPLQSDDMRPLIERWVAKGTGSVPVLVAFEYGRGKVAICGSWKVATLDYGDNATLMCNLMKWLQP
jgi:hypothetical protein